MQIFASLWTSVNLDSHIESFCKLGTFLEKWKYWIKVTFSWMRVHIESFTRKFHLLNSSCQTWRLNMSQDTGNTFLKVQLIFWQSHFRFVSVFTLYLAKGVIAFCPSPWSWEICLLLWSPDAWAAWELYKEDCPTHQSLEKLKYYCFNKTSFEFHNKPALVKTEETS